MSVMNCISLVDVVLTVDQLRMPRTNESLEARVQRKEARELKSDRMRGWNLNEKGYF